MSIPIYSNWNPAKNFIGVMLTAPIYFEVADINDGIDQNTLDIKINSLDACINGVFQAGYTGTVSLLDPFPKKIAVLLQKNTNWNYGEHITVAVKI
jgi:hypothetical protein